MTEKEREPEREQRAFLFLVNPKLAYDPYPDWQRWIPQLDVGARIRSRWNTGARRSGMAAGDLGVVVKVGQAPRGAVALVEICSEIHMGPHWNPLARSRETGYVDIEFTDLMELDDPVPLSMLRLVAAGVRWTPRMSGTEIPLQVVLELQRLVRR